MQVKSRQQGSPRSLIRPAPPKKPQHQKRWAALRKRPAVEQRTEKDRQEPGLEQLDFPTVAIPNLANVNDRHIHRPQDRQKNGVRVTTEHDERKRETDPGKDQHALIGAPEPKQSRQLQHSFRPRTEMRMNVGQINVRGIQAIATYQRY